MEHAKLNFRMSSMGGGKTLELMVNRHRKSNANFPTLVAKPCVDKKADNNIETRFGRVKLQTDVLIDEHDNAAEVILDKIARRERELAHTALSQGAWIVYIDEAQFLTSEQVVQLREDIVDTDQATVEAYGLITDFKGEFFPGSDALLRLADERIQIESYCEHDHCGRPALYNARIVDGNIAREGEQVMIDGIQASYQALCSSHYRHGVSDV